MAKIGKENLVQLLSDCDLFATVNWSMLPHMTELWKMILSDIVPLLPEKELVKRIKKLYLNILQVFF